MAILGGSPLGLIGVRSTKDINGYSTFNGGKTRNINVTNYNSGKDSYPIQNLEDNTYGGVFTQDINEGTRSMFSGPTVIAPYGMIGKGRTDTGALDVNTKYVGVDRRQLHNDQVYDTSLLNIIERLSGTEAQLRPADFAYLKDVGVYPNNRLMIARRFTKPHLDNIFGKVDKSLVMATMISWKPQTENFLEISFGEDWVDASGDFKDVLNSLGKDFLGKSLGDRVGGLAGAVPLPGFTEVLQRQVLTAMGLMEDNDQTPLPSGNPNLIKEAKRRKTIGYEGTGSGLKCTVSIKMDCEWEQKFLSGIDPTIVFQDLINKILVFSTSKSSNYGLTPQFEKTVQKWTNDPASILKDMMTYIKAALDKVVVEIKAGIDALEKSTTDTKNKTEAQTQNDILNNLKTKLASGTKEADTILRRVVSKYKIEIQGIARALTGAPSTPWHITIGNPLRPIFCAGDMYMSSEVQLVLGPTLAFNDLPSSIKASFTLQNARAWGLQEIIAKFNTGSIRVSTTIKDDMQMNSGDPQNATDKAKDGPKQENNIGGTSSGVATVTQNGSLTQDTGIKAVSNPVNSAGIATVSAGPQANTFPNNFGQPLPDTKLTAGVSNNIASAQAAATDVQNQVNTGVAGAQTAVSSAANSSKFTGPFTNSDSGVVFNPIANQTDGLIGDLSNITV